MNTKFLTIDKNIKLAYFEEVVKSSNIGVIIVHGLAEHKGRYEDFINKLKVAGISVFAIDLRGHGQSDGRRGDIKKFDDYIADLDLFVRFIKKKYPNMKISLFGHSLGGLVTAAYMAQDGIADKLILSSPSLAVGNALQILSCIPSGILGKIYIKKRHSESKEMLEYSRNDPLACKTFTLRLIKESFVLGRKQVIKSMNQIKIPMLLLGGKQDPLVKSGKFASLLDKINSNDKTLIIYENAKHRLVQNEASNKAIPDIINWLKR